MSKMLLNSALWCRVRGQHISGIVAYSNGSTKYLVLQKPYPARFYAKGKDTCSECCREPTAQTKGRRVENWPKPIDPLHPPWKADCSTAPPPPNNDPYRIKVPEIVVPPLPATNVKWLGVVWSDSRNPSQHGAFTDGFGNRQPGYPAGQHGYDQYGNPIPTDQTEEKQGFFDKIKSLFGRGKKDDKSNEYQIVSV